MAHRTCTLPDCDRRQKTRGLCSMHYKQQLAAEDAAGLPRQRVVRNVGECSQSDCDRSIKARGLCAQHYQYRRRTGADRPPCTRAGCVAPIHARQLCSAHYQDEHRRPPGRTRRRSAWVLTVAESPQPIVFGSPVLPERFWRRVTVAPSGCWHWSGALKQGYGYFTRRGAHVVAYQAFVGAIPDGMVSDHLCHTNDPDCFKGTACPHRACVRPDHIEPVTRGENGRRGHYVYTTHCPAGHAYAGDNVQIDKRGYELCRTCRRDHSRERSRRVAASRGRRPHYRTLRTHCPRKHPLQFPNLTPVGMKKGYRQCLSCNRAGNQVRKARKRGVALDWQALSDRYYAELAGTA